MIQDTTAIRSETVSTSPGCLAPATPPAIDESTAYPMIRPHQIGSSGPARPICHPTDPPSGSLPFHSSRMTRYGTTRLATGMNHHATDHPLVNRRSAVPMERRFEWLRYCQMHQTTTVVTLTIPRIQVMATTRSSAARARPMSTEALPWSLMVRSSES